LEKHWLIGDGETVGQICRMFRIGEWSGEWKLLGGHFNDNVRITTDTGRYVIRISSLDSVRPESGENGEPDRFGTKQSGAEQNDTGHSKAEPFGTDRLSTDQDENDHISPEPIKTAPSGTQHRTDRQEAEHSGTDHRRTKRLTEIFRLTRRLHSRGIPVPIPLTAGEPPLPYARLGNRLLQVIPYIRGQTFSGGPQQVHASGRMLRAFHDALADEAGSSRLEPPVSFFGTAEYCMDALGRLSAVEAVSRYGLSEARRAVKEVYHQFARVESRLPATILHGDWHFWNQHYEGDDIIGVLDLDYMQRGPRILDVAYAVWSIHILLSQHAETYRRAFLAGYGSLTDDEIELLPAAAARIALFFLCHAAESRQRLRKWHKQYATQMPFIRWLLTEGGERLRHAASGC